ncbi:hypothetical protein AA0111_g12798 [Alternaria arborescens]|uniref:hypothetical protein n=1 Tax=Alternaria arborescens TaxID=156630 RepID=UPI00107514F9|nr:hypothetical protein AA0111_g12798 [Alternaria arborescens]RYO11421.1 hypothetical protein AA0111_g12798 [Alternaria arborescens]
MYHHRYNLMSLEIRNQRAHILYSSLKNSGDYPLWNESDILDLIEHGVEDRHIRAEWNDLVNAYQASKDGAADVFLNLSRFKVQRPRVSQQLVAAWMARGLSKDIFGLNYLRSTPAPSMEDAAKCLAELGRMMGPCETMSTGDIMTKLNDGLTGEQICCYYKVRQREEQSDQAGNLLHHVLGDSRADLDDKDLWIELQYGLLYATTHLPSEPFVVQHETWVQEQYNAYFRLEAVINPYVFYVKTIRLAGTTIMRLNRRRNNCIKGGNRSKALNTIVTPEHLTAYRNVRAKIEGKTRDLDVANHSELWQFLKRLAAKLHPHPIPPRIQGYPIIQSTKEVSSSGGDPKAWVDAENHALWRCINLWCSHYGVDRFVQEDIDKDTRSDFTFLIKNECARKGVVSDRSAEDILSKVRDAIRPGPVGEKPIIDLSKRAYAMVDAIKLGIEIPDNLRRPAEAIPGFPIP